MRLTFLGMSTQGGGSPTLFATDRDTYVIQGWRLPDQTTSLEIPQKLLGYLEPGTQLGATLEDTGRGSYTLSGALVTDAEALAQMDIPGHEVCLEVSKVREGGADGIVAG